VYSLLTNLSLFELFDMGNRDYLDDDHILQTIELLGPLPADLKGAWLRYRNYFDENDIQTVFVVDWAPILGNLDENLTEEEEGQHRAGSDVDPSDSNAEEDEEDGEGRGGEGEGRTRPDGGDRNLRTRSQRSNSTRPWSRSSTMAEPLMHLILT
jgi:hypothetical protein